MRLLLDTHVWLWMQAEPEKLGERALELLDDEANDLVLSAVSAWEIAIKHALGKLELPSPPEAYVPDRMASSGVSALAVSHVHALGVASLPRHHRDPFDRLLISQATIERLPVLTADPVFEQYRVEVVAAR